MARSAARERYSQLRGTTRRADIPKVPIAADVAIGALVAPFAILFVLAIPGALTGWLAKRRGHSAVIWGGLGMLLPVFGILFLFIAGRNEDAAVHESVS